ncbi:MAG: hypothetical protein ACO3A4_02950 [Silvanigrellaceae bacterium]
MRSLKLTILPVGLFALVSCGDKPTQFSSPDSYRVAFSMSGTGVDRVQQLKQQAEAQGAAAVVLETGMSSSENAEALDDFARQLAEAAETAPAPSTSSGSTDGGGGTGGTAGGSTPSTNDGGSGTNNTGDGGGTGGSSMPSTDGGGTGGSSGGTTNTSSGGSSGGSSSTTTAPLQIPFDTKMIERLGQVAGGGLDKFKSACAYAMKIEESKVILAGSTGSVTKDQVLMIVYDGRGELNVPLSGQEIHGVCISSANGSKVNVDASNIKVKGVFTFEQGKSNATSVAFGATGKMDSALAGAIGNGNSVVLKSPKVSCVEPAVKSFGSGNNKPSLTCQ